MVKRIVGYRLPATRIVVVLSFIFYLLSFIFPSQILAQADNQQAPAQAINYQAVDTSKVSPTSPVYTDLIINNLFHTFGCLVVGSSPIGQPCLSYKISKNAQGMIQSTPVLSQVSLNRGALGSVTSLIGMLYDNPPINSSEYLASITGNFTPRSAYAQVEGSGSLVLSPLQKMWQASRNIAYMLMVLIFITIGLMVMFKQKINPQTVITAQAALPGLVIGLIMITFSYFIAGLATDTAYVGSNLVGYYFTYARGGISTADPNTLQKLDDINVITLIARLMNRIDKADISSGVNIAYSNLEGWNWFLAKIGAALISYQAANQLTGPITNVATGLIGLGTGGSGGVVLKTVLDILAPLGIGAVAAGWSVVDAPAVLGFFLWVLAYIVLLYTMFKLLMRLVNSYLSIIFLTVSAPLQFLFAALPGRQGIATDWVRNMISNALAFPAVLGVFYFAAFILGTDTSPSLVKVFGNYPKFGFTSGGIGPEGQLFALPLFGGLPENFIRVIIGYAAIVATPSIPDLVSQAVGKASKAGQIIGQQIGASYKEGRGYLGQAQGAAGQVQKDTGQLSQFSSSRTQTFSVDKAGKEHQSGVQVTPGLGAKLKTVKPFDWVRKRF